MFKLPNKDIFFSFPYPFLSFFLFLGLISDRKAPAQALDCSQNLGQHFFFNYSLCPFFATLIDFIFVERFTNQAIASFLKMIFLNLCLPNYEIIIITFQKLPNSQREFRQFFARQVIWKLFKNRGKVLNIATCVVRTYKNRIIYIRYILHHTRLHWHPLNICAKFHFESFSRNPFDDMQYNSAVICRHL